MSTRTIAPQGRPYQPATQAAATLVSAPRVRVAINIVFGTPFMWCLLYAVRGPLWWGSHRVLKDGIGRLSALAWVMVASTGALRLGVSLLFSPVAARRFLGALLVLLGSSLLFGLHQ